jgi:hypothetical protein
MCNGCDLDLIKNFKGLNEDQLIMIQWETIALHFHYKEVSIEKSAIRDPGKGKYVRNPGSLICFIG